MSRCVIILIIKKISIKTNWWPISLLNCDHKIITKVLVSRITVCGLFYQIAAAHTYAEIKH